MSSLQAALPDPQLPSDLLEGATQPWFPPNPVTPYVAASQQGSLLNCTFKMRKCSRFSLAVVLDHGILSHGLVLTTYRLHKICHIKILVA